MKRTSKPQEFKYETVRETLSAYREYVISEICRAFKFRQYDLKEVMTGFMSDCEANNPEYFTCLHDAVTMRKMLTNRIEVYYRTVSDSLHTDHNAIENFKEDRRRAAFASHSAFTR